MRGRKFRDNVERPPCPRGHTGRVLLDGHYRTGAGRFERPRYRCVPDDGSPRHSFRPQVRLRHFVAHGPDVECDACERTLRRNEGARTGSFFSFAIPEIARLLVAVGRGTSYRRASEALRDAVGKRIARGRPNRHGQTSREASLAIGYLDAFAEVVLEATRRRAWPAIVAVDALPLRIRLRTTERLATRHQWPGSSRSRGHPRKRAKLLRSAVARERGRILVASGKDTPLDKPRPILVRFMGGGDEESWLEFLCSLEGAPHWIVSDRDAAIQNAVRRAWPGQGVVHYLSQYHIAQNAAEAARRDRALTPEVAELLEELQADPANLYPLAEQIAASTNAPTLARWLADNRQLICVEQPAKLAIFPDHPKTTGAVEADIGEIKRLVKERGHLFGNADRLDRLLALVRNEIAGVASDVAYSRFLRAWFLTHPGGRAQVPWDQIRDRAGTSSIRELIREAELRQQAMRAGRQARKKAVRYRTRRSLYAVARQSQGLGAPPQGRPRPVPAGGSVAGRTVADFGWLVAEWHPTRNGTTRPEDITAGTGASAWWKCDRGPDHEWEAQVRSRTIRGTRCPFCTHRAVAPSQSLAVTHPDIAAEWHPTKNDSTPADFSYGTHAEVWWQCPRYKSHVYRARISSRTVMLSGCPACARLSGKGGRVRPPLGAGSPRVAPLRRAAGLRPASGLSR